MRWGAAALGLLIIIGLAGSCGGAGCGCGAGAFGADDAGHLHACD